MNTQKHLFGKTVVIALGGSIAYPDEIDTAFLKNFKRFIEKEIKKETKFVIVIGGGRLSRLFQTAAGKVLKVTNEDKDWLGIHTTRLNAQLLRTIFRDIADPVVIDERKKTKSLRYPVTIASGWKPGWSTDYIAAALAIEFVAGEFVVAGKPSHVYDKDPSVYKNAKPTDSISWKEYRRLIPKKWIPGFKSPVDPIAAKLADEKGVAAIIINGKDLKNFGDLLNNKNFKGTIVS